MNDNKNSSDNTLKEKLLTKLKKFSSTTTSHGIHRIVNSPKNTQKLIWLFCFLASMALCSFLIIQAILSYLHYNVTTKIREVPLEEIVFPEISLCNSNPFVTSEAEAYLRNVKRNNFNLYKLSDPDFNSTLLESFAYPLNKTLIYCQFRYADCDQTYFVRYFHPYYGNCYLFNYDRNSPYTVSREGDGLQIELFIGPSNIYHEYKVC